MDGAFHNQGGGEGFDGDDRGERRGFRGTSENAKTRLCMRWKNGHCRFGDRCNFAHGEEELRHLPPREERGGFQGGGRGRGGYGYNGGYNEGYGGPPNRGPGGGYGGADYYRGGGGYGGYGGGPGGAGNMPGGGGGYGPRGPAPGGDGAGRGMGNGGDNLWAQQGYPVTGPGGWTQYRTQDTGELYYHNSRTGETVWEQPPGWQGQ